MIGFFGLLQVAFIVLKLTSYIDWSWWLVLSPALTCVVGWAITLIVGVVLPRFAYKAAAKMSEGFDKDFDAPFFKDGPSSLDPSNPKFAENFYRLKARAQGHSDWQRVRDEERRA
jgi:hypothetical protein